jgi:hypothetical protein
MAVLTFRPFAGRILPILLLGALLCHQTHAGTVDEYQVKAAFLYNFAQFVEWSPESFSTADEAIGICVLGKNPFGSTLQDGVKGKVVAGRTFTVRELSDAKQAVRCHILFVSAAEQERSMPFLAELKGRSVLTVGETDRFVAAGGIISFSLRDSRVRFEIDAGAASAAKLKISSKLLGLAENTKNSKRN